MIATLRQRSFALLWVAGLISMLGDEALFVALPLHVYEVTGSALATGAMFVSGTVPPLLFGSIAGVLVDRWDRQRVMVVVNLLRAPLVLLVLAAQSPEWLWIIYPVAFVQASLACFFGPAENALLPPRVGRESLVLPIH